VCEQIAIAGSLRRGKATVGDIEIVAIPKWSEIQIAAQPGQLDLFGNMTGGTPATVERVSLLDRKLEELATARIIEREHPHTAQKARWGAKMKECWHSIDAGDGIGYIKVDLFIVTPPAQWGPIVAIRTGPGDFGQAVMTWINRSTPYQQVDGHLEVRDTGAVVDTPTEESYFEVLGIPWIAPEKRSIESLGRAAKRPAPPRVQNNSEPAPEVSTSHPDTEAGLSGSITETVLAVLRDKGKLPYPQLRGTVEGRLDKLFDTMFFSGVMDRLVNEKQIVRSGEWDYSLPGFPLVYTPYGTTPREARNLDRAREFVKSLKESEFTPTAIRHALNESDAESVRIGLVLIQEGLIERTDDRARVVYRKKAQRRGMADDDALQLIRTRIEAYIQAHTPVLVKAA
jgi:hypothetical protein